MQSRKIRSMEARIGGRRLPRLVPERMLRPTMRIVFFGSPEIAAACLRSLRAHDRHEVVAVVTQPDRPVRRSKTPRPPAVKVAAEGLPVFQPESVGTRAFRRLLVEQEAEVGVVVAYGCLLGPKLLATLPRGFVNVHASLLPRWRGASPIEAAILHGDEKSGVSIMQMDEGLDTGPVFSFEELVLDPRETAITLHDRLTELGADVLPRALDGIEAGELHARPQSESPYGPPITCGKIESEDRRIDWTHSAVEVDRHVRAFVARGAYTDLGGARFRIHATAPTESDELAGDPGALAVVGGRILVATGRGTLEILELQKEGRKRCSAAEFLRGNDLDPGARFE